MKGKQYEKTQQKDRHVLLQASEIRYTEPHAVHCRCKPCRLASEHYGQQQNAFELLCVFARAYIKRAGLAAYNVHVHTAGSEHVGTAVFLFLLLDRQHARTRVGHGEI